MDKNSDKQKDKPQAPQAPQNSEKKPKISSSNIHTPLGTRQDVLDEFSRLVKELDENQKTGKRKFGEFLKTKDIQFTKSFEPSVEKDVGGEMPIDGDHLNGSRVFMRYCASCHSLEESNQGRNSVMGPALGLIYGKKAGSDRYFNYSNSYVMSPKAWTEKNLFEYLLNPKKDFPESRCLIQGGGLKDEGERADVSKFLRLFSKNLRIYLTNKAKRTFGEEYIQSYTQAQRKADQATYSNIQKMKKGE